MIILRENFVKTIVSIILFVVLQPALSIGNERNFLIFYSNDVRGETEPCG